MPVSSLSPAALCAARSCSDYLTQSAYNPGFGFRSCSLGIYSGDIPKVTLRLSFWVCKSGRRILFRVYPRNSSWPGSLYCRWSMQQVQLGVQFLSCFSPCLCPHPFPCTPVTCLPGSRILLAQLLFSVCRVLLPVFLNLVCFFFNLNKFQPFL